MHPTASSTRLLPVLLLLAVAPITIAAQSAKPEAAHTAPASQPSPHKIAPHKATPNGKKKSAQGKNKSAAAKVVKTEAKAEVKPVAPLAPPDPHWPVREQPSPARVQWDSRGLRIEAQNSSLIQILEAVATATGMKVEGLGDDQRIFGNYGPGPAREVLLKLFEGSGYNLLMIGEQGSGTPRQIQLTSRNGAGGGGATIAPSRAAAADDDDDEPEPEQSQPQPEPDNENQPHPGGPPPNGGAPNGAPPQQ